MPEVRTEIHQHGLNVEPESDGQAEAWTSPAGVTGPEFVTHVHDLPNRQPRMTGTYHDHTLGISRLNNYAGLHGFYVIEGPREDQLGLPTGEYDVPIMLADKTFESDGSLHYPDEFTANFAGDTAFVNGAVWPYLEVEPRRYRFRLVNQSNGRTFALSLSNDDGHDAPAMYQFAPDQGYLGDVVPVGHGGDLESLTIAPFERAEVVVDFSQYAGETFTVTNEAGFPYSGGHGGGHGGDGPDLSEIMQIRVSDDDVTDDSTHPSELSLPNDPGYDPDDAERPRHMTLGMRDDAEPPTHVLNGKTFHDGGDHARPRKGATEVWEFENETMHSHPIHMHLIEFRVIGRGEDGTADPAPNERGPKDVVRVDPGETVRVVTKFGDFTGTYPWHCHVLEHEEQGMMRPFEVVDGDSASDGQGSGGNGTADASTESGNADR
ncbi:multicopper oxidase family protein [Halomicrobium salinisoli]|uniref:multicopper oxidase family protein n=1 Tax=Halomicrobium salinisoli TaxID=2878391 RepID=UPI001CF0484A|nr:multicopper oxidase domain-containing protein [Halomicrobium salinisoli]